MKAISFFHRLACQHCELQWEEWTECTDGIRSRTEYVSVFKVGAGNPCPELETETEGKAVYLVFNTRMF